MARWLLLAALLALGADAKSVAKNEEKYLKRTGRKFLAAKAAEEGAFVLPSGMVVKVLSSAQDEAAAWSPMEATTAKVHYHGTLKNGEVFDSSVDRGQPSEFAPNQVIKGWTEALQLMCEGDKWELSIPYELAYGERGSPPRIGPFSPLVFEVEIVEVLGKKKTKKPCSEARDLFATLTASEAESEDL